MHIIFPRNSYTYLANVETGNWVQIKHLFLIVDYIENEGLET